MTTPTTTKLTTENGTATSDLSPARIADVLKLLNGTDNQFAILDTPGGFLQTVGDERSGFVLEWSRDWPGETKPTVRRAGDPIATVDAAAEIFNSYAAGDVTRLEGMRWEGVVRRSKPLPLALVALGVVMIVAYVTFEAIRLYSRP